MCPPRPRDVVVHGHHGTGRSSGDGERVVAELGQDVAGLPDDFAGLGRAARLLFLRSLTEA